ncbi:hypothetical protein ZBT109_1155 [Zymobacter palmae]|uniref:Uncharacterized protein n=1 Tax=Zymobacter palmae TaxID=33074 RepID=A0A348HE64_9GAMM|nr:hypothetical protein ZBT109_1155 [Zymobacter palmae]
MMSNDDLALKTLGACRQGSHESFIVGIVSS